MLTDYEPFEYTRIGGLLKSAIKFCYEKGLWSFVMGYAMSFAMEVGCAERGLFKNGGYRNFLKKRDSSESL